MYWAKQNTPNEGSHLAESWRARAAQARWLAWRARPARRRLTGGQRAPWKVMDRASATRT